MKCRKRRYPTEWAAIRACLKTSKKYGHGMRPYYCHECRAYHVTSRVKDL